jgi:ABC-type spermidine/putrescine transport system permease subunit II
VKGEATSLSLGAWYGVIVLFLFSPIATSIVYSFNLGTLGKQTSLFTGWTTGWYGAAWEDLSLRASVATSLEVAFWAAAVSLAIGSILGFVLVRYRKPMVRRLLSTATYLLLIVPETVTGVSLLLFYAETGIPLSKATLVAGLTPSAIAVTALIIRARVLRLVVLPQLLPAVAAGGLMAYVFSFDNVVVSSFLTTPAVNTLPVYLYGSLQYGPAPTVYAAATAVFLFTLLVMGLALLCYRLAGKRHVLP